MSANNVLHVDPGPLARFREVIEDPTTMSVIAQRLTDGEALKDIAVAWKIPYGRLAEWIIEDRDRSEQYNQALQIWTDALAQESVRIADDAGEADSQVGVQRDKLRIETRLKLASKLNRARYGDAVEHKHTGSVSLIAVLSSLPRGREIDATPPVALPAPAGTLLEKKSEKKPEEFEI